MGPDGTVYIIINFIISIVLSLYIAALIKSRDCTDSKTGIIPTLVSALLMFATNFGILCGYSIKGLDAVWQFAVAAVFVAIGCLVPLCVGLAKWENLASLCRTLHPTMAILNCTVTFFITLPVRVIFALFRIDAETEVTQEDVMELVEDASDEVIDDEQKEMIENIFEFGGLTAGDVMTHRTAVFAVDGNECCVDVIEKLKTEGFSRVPVYQGSIDTITGVLFAKDLLGVLGNEAKLYAPVKDLARSTMFVPASCPADQLLMQFKANHRQLAVVVDEYGGTSGIVTMEDILEEIVGNIQDEYDHEEEMFQKIDENTIICKAAFDIEEALELFGFDRETAEIADADFDTVGGLIMHLLARIPEQDEQAVVDYKGIRFTVLEVADRRIIRVKAEKLPPAENEE